MKKLCSAVIALLLCLALLAGCGGASGASSSTPPDLPEGMEAAEVETRAKALIDAMNARDYNEMVALFTNGESLGITPPTAEGWAEAVEGILDQLGDFKEYGGVSFASVNQEPYGNCGVVLVETKYENQTLIWQVSFSEDMELIGLVA